MTWWAGEGLAGAWRYSKPTHSGLGLAGIREVGHHAVRRGAAILRTGRCDCCRWFLLGPPGPLGPLTLGKCHSSFCRAASHRNCQMRARAPCLLSASLSRSRARLRVTKRNYTAAPAITAARALHAAPGVPATTGRVPAAAPRARVHRSPLAHCFRAGSPPTIAFHFAPPAPVRHARPHSAAVPRAAAGRRGWQPAPGHLPVRGGRRAARRGGAARRVCRVSGRLPARRDHTVHDPQRARQRSSALLPRRVARRRAAHRLYQVPLLPLRLCQRIPPCCSAVARLAQVREGGRRVVPLALHCFLPCCGGQDRLLGERRHGGQRWDEWDEDFSDSKL